MKIAIVHDGLMCVAGGERVALHFHKAFPDAPIYTLCYQPNLTFPEFKDCEVRTSQLQKIAKTNSKMKNLFFPLGILAMKGLDVTEYDVVLMSGTHCAKYVKTNPKALIISYTYTPFRLAWDPTSYGEFENANTFKKTIFKSIVEVLRKIDFYYSKKVTFFLAMTEETKKRISDSYKPTSAITIIKPAIDTSQYYISDEIGDYFLIVSRMEYYKKVDLVIDAFNKLGLKLIVVGNGTKKSELKARAKQNITFLEGVSNEELASLYSKCKAFIFPQHEDYGLTALEANASGRPVIAYGAGGILSTMIPMKNNPKQATALFFDNQSVEELMEAVKKFEALAFDTHFIKQHAENFSEQQFIYQIRHFISEKFMEHSNLTK